MVKFVASYTLLKYFGESRFFNYLFVVNPLKISEIRDINLMGIAYRTLVMPNKTTKQTSKKRFKELDNLTFDLLEKKVNPKVLDVGISSGLTTYELFQLLDSKRKNFQLDATDKYSKIKLYKTWFYCTIINNQKIPISIYWGGLYLSNLMSWKYFTSKILFKIISKFIIVNPKKIMEVPLFYSGFTKLVEKNKVRFFDHDVLKPFQFTNYDFIRVMNIINLSYFTEDQIQKAIANLRSTLKEGGVLMVGRTFHNQNHVSIYIKKGSKLVPKQHVNNGSEINEIVIN